jgi:hypothetical protein
MKNFSFTSKRLYVFDREIPSDLSMNAILNELTVEDKDIFIAHSDKFICGFYSSLDPNKYNPDDIIDLHVKLALEIKIEIVKTYQLQCEILELDFQQFWQSYAVISWFRYMAANSRSFHVQQIGRELLQFINAVNDEATIDTSNIFTEKDRSILAKYPEHQEALSIIDGVFYLINFSSKRNNKMSDLFARQLILHSCLASVSEEKDTSDRLFICPYCKRLQVLNPGVKERKYCGSKECENEYDKRRQGEWRLSQKPSTKAVFVPAFDGKPRNCKGSKCLKEGGRRVQVNIDYLCKRCLKDLDD